jgi:hypothetical protein
MVKNVSDTTKVRARVISVEKYRGGPYWSIWLGEELLAVTVYKKGAVAIKDLLTEIGDCA